MHNWNNETIKIAISKLNQAKNICSAADSVVHNDKYQPCLVCQFIDEAIDKMEFLYE